MHLLAASATTACTVKLTPRVCMHQRLQQQWGGKTKEEEKEIKLNRVRASR